MAKAAAKWDLELDVVVVGSGIAGMAAAATAASHDLRVVVFEKGREIGGTSVLSSGEYWVPNNRWLRADGIEDPREDCLRYMARLSYPSLYDPEAETLGLPRNEFELLEAYYDRGSEAVDHLDEIGAIKSRYSPDFDKPMGKPEYNAHVRALEKGQVKGFEDLDKAAVEEVDAMKEMEKAKLEIQELESRKAVTRGADGAPAAPNIKLTVSGIQLIW